MNDFDGVPYAEWLEEAIKTIFEQNPDRIAICATLPDGDTLTAYYNCCAEDKAIFSYHINSDAMLDVVLTNIGLIKEEVDKYDG